MNNQTENTVNPINLSELLEQHKDKLLVFIKHNMNPILQRKVEPSDILQETMISALKSINQVDFRRYDSYHWLCHLAEQRIIDAHRRYIKAEKRSARQEIGLESPLTESKPGGLIEILAASLTSPTQAIRKDEYLRELAVFLDQLPENQKMALQMRYAEGLSIRKISERLGKSNGAVRVILSRTMAKLQNLMYKDDCRN